MKLIDILRLRGYGKMTLLDDPCDDHIRLNDSRRMRREVYEVPLQQTPYRVREELR